MIDFEAELAKLLAGESEPLPQCELAEILAESRNLLEILNKRQADFSLQIEEVYDLAKDADTRELQGVLNAERGRSQQLLGAVVGLSDMLEHFCVYAEQSGSAELEHQGRLLWQNARRLLESCGIVRLGEAGQPLNPALHTVQSAVFSEFPKEYIVRVLQSGYLYPGMMLRKAVVVVSRGNASPNPEMKNDEYLDEEDNEDIEEDEDIDEEEDEDDEYIEEDDEDIDAEDDDEEEDEDIDDDAEEDGDEDIDAADVDEEEDDEDIEAADVDEEEDDNEDIEAEGEVSDTEAEDLDVDAEEDDDDEIETEGEVTDTEAGDMDAEEDDEDIEAAEVEDEEDDNEDIEAEGEVTDTEAEDMGEEIGRAHV
jgi:molecular chaperone GrpE (heat shock protein)